MVHTNRHTTDREEFAMRRTVFVAFIGAFALLAAACTPSVTVESTDGATGDASAGIAVSGTGKIVGAPDTLTMSFGVSVLEDSVTLAVSRAAESADAVIASLTAAGVAEEDIQTTNYSIFPQYDYRNEAQSLIGYQVNNTVTAKVRDVDAAGGVIDDVVSAGGNTVTVSGVSFSIEDNEQLVEAARAAAWDDARSKAEQLAGLAGVTLGAPTSIVETSSAPPIPVQFDEAALSVAADTGTPIAPGTQQVAVTLTVVYSLDQ
jgi:uncharacterized protein YggE